MTFGCWNKTKISRISSGGIEGIHSIQEERLNVDYAECRLQSRKLATGRVRDSDVKRFREICFTWYMSEVNRPTRDGMMSGGWEATPPDFGSSPLRARQTPASDTGRQSHRSSFPKNCNPTILISFATSQWRSYPTIHGRRRLTMVPMAPMALSRLARQKQASPSLSTAQTPVRLPNPTLHEPTMPYPTRSFCPTAIPITSASSSLRASTKSSRKRPSLMRPISATG